MDERMEKTAAVYERHLAACLKQWGSGTYRPPDLLVSLVSLLSEGERVLDAGCGLGRDVRYLSRRGLTPVGLDRTRGFLDWARRSHSAGRFILGDLRIPPFQEESFGAVWAAASMIHLSKRDVRRTLRAFRGATRSRGWMAATFVHGTASGFLSRGWLPGRYFSRWTKAELARAVRTAGWRIVRLECVANRERKGRWLNLLARRDA